MVLGQSPVHHDKFGQERVHHDHGQVGQDHHADRFAGIVGHRCGSPQFPLPR